FGSRYEPVDILSIRRRITVIKLDRLQSFLPSCESLVSRHAPQSHCVQSLGDTFERIALVRIAEMEQHGTAYAGRQTGLIRMERAHAQKK
ncbi:hypothetical protein, partial [Paraburkholderia caledonica]|uniref:hypothetical protein n=1 Tax=Paraburkholderia caledonica TaxID=134536 RepID=UPI001C4E50AA